MAQRFEFDDDVIDNEEDVTTEKVEELNQGELEIIENKNANVQKFSFDDEKENITEINNSFSDISNLDEEDESMAKKKKLKPWVIVLLGLVLVGLVFVVYLFTLTNNDGPVYGNRCEGVTAVNIDARNNTVSMMKSKYSDIKDLTIEITCKQIKVDITYIDKMDTKKAIEIAEETVKTLDEQVGLPKDNGKTYSHLFGYVKNEAQYDCQLILMSKDSKDFTIYGTKHHSLDEFSYTYSSVKDEDSKNKAEQTLNKK